MACMICMISSLSHISRTDNVMHKIEFQIELDRSVDFAFQTRNIGEVGNVIYRNFLRLCFITVGIKTK